MRKKKHEGAYGQGENEWTRVWRDWDEPQSNKAGKKRVALQCENKGKETPGWDVKDQNINSAHKGGIGTRGRGEEKIVWRKLGRR